jgi:hypothetical protein
MRRGDLARSVSVTHNRRLELTRSFNPKFGRVSAVFIGTFECIS